MLILLDSADDKIGAITNIENFSITETIDSGEEQLSFEIHVQDSLYPYLTEESCFLYNDNRYVVKSIDERNGTSIFGCRLDLSSLQKKPVKDWVSSGQELFAFLNTALLGTGWVFDIDLSLKSSATVELDSGNVLDLITIAQKSYNVVFRFNCISKILTVISYENHVHRGVYFTDELNLKECTIRGESFELVTRLYVYGNEGLTFSSINNGKEYIDNNSYSNKVISDVWVDERYKSAVELKRAAEQRLAKSAVPNRVYTASFVDIANLNPEYSCLSVAIGDRITLVDRVRKVKIEHQIMKIVKFPLEPERNMLELGQLQKTLENTITNISTKTAEKAIHTAQLGNVSKWNSLTILDDKFTVVVGANSYSFSILKDSMGRIIAVNDLTKQREVSYGES